MKKFSSVYKEKKQKSESLHERKVVRDFKKVYKNLLEHYNVKEFNDLKEKYQNVFLADIHKLWDENTGITERGVKFIMKNSDLLTENSTTLQKKNYLKKKAVNTIHENLHSSDLKYKLYDVIDEMYHEIKATNVSEVLSPDLISDVIYDSFQANLKKFVNNIREELQESAKEKKLAEKGYSETEGKVEEVIQYMKDNNVSIKDIQGGVNDYGYNVSLKENIKSGASIKSKIDTILQNNDLGWEWINETKYGLNDVRGYTGLFIYDKKAKANKSYGKLSESIKNRTVKKLNENLAAEFEATMDTIFHVYDEYYDDDRIGIEGAMVGPENKYQFNFDHEPLDPEFVTEVNNMLEEAGYEYEWMAPDVLEVYPGGENEEQSIEDVNTEDGKSSIPYGLIIDEIFSIYDEYYDDSRRGISGGYNRDSRMYGPDTETYVINFEHEPLDPEFMDEVIELLNDNDIKYNWSDTHLVLYLT